MIRKGSTITMSVAQYDELEKKEEVAMKRIAKRESELAKYQAEIRALIEKNCVAVEDADTWRYARGYSDDEVGILRYKYKWYDKSDMVQKYKAAHEKEEMKLIDKENELGLKEQALAEMSFFAWLKARRNK